MAVQYGVASPAVARLDLDTRELKRVVEDWRIRRAIVQSVHAAHSLPMDVSIAVSVSTSARSQVAELAELAVNRQWCMPSGSSVAFLSRVVL
jgi:hypothetical protein